MFGFHFTSFRSRMLTIIVGAVLISQSLTYFLFNYVANQNAHYLISQNLESASRYFRDIIHNQFELLTDSAIILVDDFAFKRSLRTANENTINITMLNHQDRIGADIMVAFKPSGEYIASTLQNDSADLFISALDKKIEKSFEVLISKMSDENLKSLSAIIYVQDIAYQIALVPIKAPRTIAYVAIGYKMDDRLAAKIQTISSSSVTLLVTPTTPEFPAALRHGQIVGSTTKYVGPNELNTLSVTSTLNDSILLQQKNGQVINRIVAIDQANENLKFYALIQISFDDVLENYTKYLVYLTGLTIFLILLSVPFAIIIARRITFPIDILVRATEKIEKGDYATRIYIEQNDEIGLLGDRFNDMTKGLAEREKMEFMAFHDSLTHLPNRRSFFQSLENALKDQEQSTLIMFDLDGFKSINDNHGHDAGDATLREISDRLKDYIVQKDDIIARLGGDEFSILFSHTNDKYLATARAEKIIEIIEEPIHFNGIELSVSASLGIHFAHPELTVSEWMKGADLACYNAKTSGKNTFKFYEG